jgi:ABC-type glutathione transport system ATPase component
MGKVKRVRKAMNTVQFVRSTAEKVLVGTYLTNKGEILMGELKQSGLRSSTKEYKARKEEIELKYMKNRYALNPESKIVKMIKHKPIVLFR